MNRYGTLLCALLLAAPSAHAWMGVKRPRAAAPQADTARPAVPAPGPVPARPAISRAPADTVRLDRQVLSIPAGSHGRYLGTLEGVRCFNCEPDRVQLNLGDSVTTEAAVLTLHIDVWNAIERPLKDCRLYDYSNRCFYFGYKEKDTAFVGGEWTEIRVQELPCYPYLQRTLQASRTTAGTPPRPAPDEVPRTAASPAPAPSAPVPAATAAVPSPEAARPRAPAPVPARLPKAVPDAPVDVVLEPADD